MLLSISWDINAIKTKGNNFHSKSELIEDIEDITCQHFYDKSKMKSVNFDEIKECIRKVIYLLLPKEKSSFYI